MYRTLVTFGVRAFPGCTTVGNRGTLWVNTTSLAWCKVGGGGGSDYFTSARRARSRLEAYQIWSIQQVQGKEWSNLIGLMTCYFLILVLLFFRLTVFIILNGPPINFWSSCELDIWSNVVLRLWRPACMLQKQQWASEQNILQEKCFTSERSVDMRDLPSNSWRPSALSSKSPSSLWPSSLELLCVPSSSVSWTWFLWWRPSDLDGEASDSPSSPSSLTMATGCLCDTVFVVSKINLVNKRNTFWLMGDFVIASCHASGLSANSLRSRTCVVN